MIFANAAVLATILSPSLLSSDERLAIPTTTAEAMEPSPSETLAPEKDRGRTPKEVCAATLKNTVGTDECVALVTSAPSYRAHRLQLLLKPHPGTVFHSTYPGWIINVLRESIDLRLAAGPLLETAREQRAKRFGLLWNTVCRHPNQSTAGAPPSCTNDDASLIEDGWGRAVSRRQKVYATAFVGLVTLGTTVTAFLTRNDSSSDVLAGISGASLGVVSVVTLLESTPRKLDLGYVLLISLLGVPALIGGGVGGYIVADRLAEDPGMTRFMVTALPMAAIMGIQLYRVRRDWNDIAKDRIRAEGLR